MKTLFKSVLFSALAGLASLGAQTPAAPAEQPPRPLTLDAALAYALKHNPTLNRIREQVREQEGVLISVNAQRLPQANATSRYSRTDEELLAVPGGTQDTWQLEASVSQTLYAGGGLHASSAAQRTQIEAARLAVLAQSADTLLTVRQNFYRVLLNRELIGVREEELRVLEKEAVDARARREVGSGSDFDVLRAEVAVANAKPALIRIRNAYRTSQDSLRQALGAPADASSENSLEIEGVLDSHGEAPELAVALRAAHDARPELLRQKQLAEAARLGIKVARAGYLPTVSAYAAYDWTNSAYSDRWNRRLDGLTVGVKSNWAIFDGRATAGKVRQARSQVEQARLALEELALAIDVEVRLAHAALVEANELLTSAEQTVAQATESLRLAQARHAAGAATQLDVLTAQVALTEARSSFSQARHDQAVAVAQLQRASGAPPLSTEQAAAN
ncbi:MAG TPA: TolC family protein [Opitutaceae bacterium]|nr:TolC family protein [Opitutaceae bacterium]